MLKTVIPFLLFIFTLSCGKKPIDQKIQGSWVIESIYNNKYINNDDGFGGITYPVIFEFCDNDSVIRKNYQTRLFEKLEWSILNDSTISLQGDTLHIKQLNDHSLIFLDLNQPDAKTIFLYKPIKTNINYSSEQLEHHLKGTWGKFNQRGDTILMDFIENQKLIIQYNSYDRFLKDSIRNSQVENWRVIEHDKNYFVAFTKDGFGNSSWNFLNQIIDISPSNLSLLIAHKDSTYIENWTKINETNTELDENLLGLWVSKNDTINSYGCCADSGVFNRKKYQDSLFLDIHDDRLTLKLRDLDSLNYSWNLTGNGKTLAIHQSINQEDYQGCITETIEVLFSDDNELLLKFNNNTFPDYDRNSTPPVIHYINLLQSFKKIEN